MDIKTRIEIDGTCYRLDSWNVRLSDRQGDSSYWLWTTRSPERLAYEQMSTDGERVDMVIAAVAQANLKAAKATVKAALVDHALGAAGDYPTDEAVTLDDLQAITETLESDRMSGEVSEPVFQLVSAQVQARWAEISEYE